MKTVLFQSAEQAVIVEREIPKPRKDEVLLKMERIGVCGTDIQVFMGRNRYMKFPLVPFHEGLAFVEESGEGVTEFKKGDRVCVNPIISCGTCYSCTHDRPNACENFDCLGVQSDGLGAEYFCIHKKYLYQIPLNADPDVAVLTEPFAVGIHAAKQGNVPGKRVMVLGAGTIGNFVAQAAGLLGAESVCICDISEEKVAMAERSGIPICVNTSGITLKEAGEKAFGGFPDVIIDCVGAPSLFGQILELAGKTTTLVIVGNYSSPTEVDLAKIQRNELNVFGSITYTPEDFQTAVDFITSGRVYTKGFITGRYKLEDAQAMMEQAAKFRGVNMKTVMDYR